MMVALSVVLGGCAFVYTDRDTGAVHVWGFGHLAMRATVPNEGKQGMIRSATTYGLATGVWDHDPFVSVGWERKQTVEIFGDDTSIRIEPADTDLLGVRIGSRPPMATKGEDGP